MRDADLQPARAERPEDPPATGRHTSDDADRLRPAVSGNGRRAVWPKLARVDSVIPASGSPDENSGPVSGGGQHASRAGSPDGSAIRTFGGGLPACRLDFAQSVPPNGYVWWYVDALSDDGTHGITVIAFLGSVFSPYYAFARRKGPADPLDHCSINVSIYRKGGNRWAMTERPHGAVERRTNSLSIGPSHLHWDGDCLTITIDEITVPIPRRIRGTVRVRPDAITQQGFVLNSQGDHNWWPIAPSAHVEVALQRPDLQWQGRGYFDTNQGSAPVEAGFSDWQWACGPTRNGAVILYEALRRDGGVTNLALEIDQQGRVQNFEPPPVRKLKRTGWRVGRSIRSDRDASVVRTLQDSPFYARSVVSASLRDEPLVMMHESLSLDRFKMPIVQAMLPFRMPRARR